MAERPRVLLVIAHPAIASGIETLLALEGDYDLRRIPSPAQVPELGEWRPDVAFVDGTLLPGYDKIRIGAPAYVLSGNEHDGRQLARRLDDGRGWVRKDATGADLAQAVNAIAAPELRGGLGLLGIVTIVALALVVLLLVAYLVWLAIG